MAENNVRMQGIIKRFPGVVALDGVDLSCSSGEVHAVVGENGAGKSTLMKILAGAYLPDAGTISIQDEEVFFSSPSDAQRHGISIIYQEFNLIPELNVAENIYLGREPRGGLGFIDSARMHERARVMLDNLGIRLDLKARVATLGVAQQQMVEIAKALSQNADIIVMDEPSAVVSGKELESLFHTIRALKANGKTIIYISHRIDEIFQIADRTTVLKDGKLVGTVRTADVSKATVISMMVGRSLAETFPPRGKRGEKKEVLALNNVSAGGVLKNVSLRVYGGEILGIAGLVGAGRTELARAIFGADPISSGEIQLGGRKGKRRFPRKSIAEGVGFVTENRAHDGLVHSFSIKKNITLPILNKVKKVFLILEKSERRIGEKATKQFNIIAPSVNQEVRFLSGGNQQKVILAKWMNIDPTLLILDEPTRGIDVGAKSEVYSLMRQIANRGTAIIMISSELPEILGMSDRILVMRYGEIMGELSVEEATEEKILMLATGQAERRPLS